jgi:hypothetical protein
LHQDQTWLNFLDAFVKGQGTLPKMTGPIQCLPSAWRRGIGHPPDTVIPPVVNEPSRPIHT